MGPLLALALVTAHYGFEPGARHDYLMDAEFNGFLPLLGGNTGKAEIRLGIAVTGESKSGTEIKAASEITSFQLEFNDAPLPFGLETVQDFFPRAVVTLDPQGKILSNTAPDKDLPVRLPGLDPKRMPDITFVPLCFPDKGLEVGETWKFEKPFAGAPIFYTCQLEKLDGDQAQIAVAVKQTFSVLENDSVEVVKKEADAVATVKTEMVGSGRVWFDLKQGLALGSTMKNTAISKVTPLKKGAPSERKMVTTLVVTKSGFTIPKVEEVSPKTGAPVGQPPTRVQSEAGFFSQAASLLSGAWNWAGQQTQSLLATLNGYRVLAAFALSQVPVIGPSLAQGLIKS